MHALLGFQPQLYQLREPCSRLNCFKPKYTFFGKRKAKRQMQVSLCQLGA